MELNGKTIVLTGAASGIGAAMARRFAEESPGALVLVDIDPGVRRIAEELGATGAIADVSVGDAVEHLVADVRSDHGHIDLFCSNAGIATGAGIDASPDTWQRTWDVNVMAHVHAARAVLPGMLERGAGYLLNTASAAGLLTNIGDAPYSVTKHAAVALAEWISVTYGDRGVKVSCLCPQGVRTPMLLGGVDDGHLGAHLVAAQGLIEPEECAEAVIAGLREERFLILPHPEVAEYVSFKANDIDKWLRGMRKLQTRAPR